MRLANRLWAWLLGKIGFLEAERYMQWMADTWPKKESP